MEKAIRKIRNSNGESLAETLVALLIAALGILLLAGMVISSSNMVKSSRQKIIEYVGLENKLVEQSEAANNGQLNMVNTASGDPVRFTKDEDDTVVSIKYFEVNYGKTKIISFKK